RDYHFKALYKIYKELFKNLNGKENNLVIINQRRPVTYDLESIKILKKSNCKLISKNNLFKKNDWKEIKELRKEFSEKLLNIWDNENFKDIFKINDFEFWTIIKNDFKQVFTKRINEYIESVFFAKKIFSNINISCILSLYDIGETEKVFLKSKNENIDSFLLEHGFGLLFEDSKTFGTLASYDNFRDNIVVWSSQQKQFLISNYKIKPNKIFAIGSPRHDQLLKIKKSSTNKKFLQVLIAPTPITQIQGFDTSEIHEKFENTITKLCQIFERYENVKIIFKLHPSQSGHNNEIKQIIQKYSKKIPIYLLNSVSNLIQKSDAVITITPEGWAPSTIVLESMILGKPVMNIVLDEKIYEFEYIKQNAVIAIPYIKNLENEIQQILFDNKLREELIKNSKIFVKNFLNNHGSASKKLADILRSY
ncbi:MAG: CDP-glycerol glycerophosphotransferase family protein, partial [Pelagibacterales bacterium]|nr:CDP-glycerol glycerophosphotransferase family protein [Pelagibacterales bacterium]